LLVEPARDGDQTAGSVSTRGPPPSSHKSERHRNRHPADGTLANTITVRDFKPLDGSRSTKVYARDVGIIQDSKLEPIRLTG
jgi:hypothetical protein